MPVEEAPEAIHIGYSALPLVHSEYHKCGVDTVDDKEQYAEPCQRNPDIIRNLFDQPFQTGIGILYPKQGENSSEEAVQQIDPSVQIQGKITVIP